MKKLMIAVVTALAGLTGVMAFQNKEIAKLPEIKEGMQVAVLAAG